MALSCACAALSLFAKPVALDGATWRGNPFDWDFSADGSSASTRGTGDLLVNKGENACIVEVSARLAPEAGGTNGWSTLGVAVVADAYNFWHLALVQAPQNPDGSPGRRFFELCEMRNGEWLAHMTDGLVRTHMRASGTWRYGEECLANIKLDGDGVSGTVRDSSGKVLFEAGYLFPDKEKDGSVRAVTFGRPALHSNGGFRGAFSQVEALAKKPVGKTRARKCAPYSCESFAEGVAERATGFFHMAKMEDGRWWAIDPLGRGMVMLGVDHVTYHGHRSERTGRSIHHETNKVKFPRKADWEEDALGKLKAWGFNMLGAGCDAALYRRGLAHSINLIMGDALCRDGMPPECFICPNEHHPCSALPNMFHPKFPAWCDYVASRKCAPNRDDPWLFGYFLDNELAWWGRGKRDCGLYDAVAALPESHPARDVQLRFLQKHGVAEATPELKLEFLRLAAERYFKVMSAAIRRHDPNHMVLGCRFAGVNGAHPVVWETAGRYCDVVTFNCYPWADLDRNEMRIGAGRSTDRMVDAFERKSALANRPILITEWSFPALDTGRPCTYGAGQRFRTQAERTRATALCARTMLALKCLIGYDYFMWVDQPAAGISDAFPEDSNYGLISETGEPYAGLVSMFARLHKNVAAWRTAPPPAVIDAPPPGGPTASDFIARYPKGSATLERRKDRFTVRNAAGLEISTAVGARQMLDSVRLGGRSAGTFTAMVCDTVDGNRRWRDAVEVTNVRWREEDGRGSLTVTAEGGSKASGFAITLRITPLVDRPAFVAELVRVENIGAEPINVSSFFFREYAPYASNDKPLKSVPNLWKGLACDAWFSPEGEFYYGGLTTAPTAANFRYAVSNDGNHQHPDAEFMPFEALVLAPGRRYEPKGLVWMLAVCGSDGVDGWRRTLSEYDLPPPLRSR